MAHGTHGILPLHDRLERDDDARDRILVFLERQSLSEDLDRGRDLGQRPPNRQLGYPDTGYWAGGRRPDPTSSEPATIDPPRPRVTSRRRPAPGDPSRVPSRPHRGRVERPRPLTLDEDTDLLRTTRKAIYCQIQRGELPGVIRRSRRVLVDGSALLEWPDQRRTVSLQMVYISKVYTKSGDGGDTMLAGGDRVRKSAPRIEAYGTVDELNACIGIIRTEVAREPRRTGAEVVLDEMDAQLARIQQELFDLGGELASPGAASGKTKLTVEDRHVTRLETELDAWNDPLPPLKSFVLPGGGPVGTACHLARTVCRRAERRAVELFDTEEEAVRSEAIRYLNRLSDYLFVLGRAAAQRLGDPEVLWSPAST